MKKESLIILIACLCLLIGLGIGFLVFSPNSPLKFNKLKVCPDAWYDNQMPGENGSEYLIIDGRRAELKDYNLSWIRENCEVNKPSMVW